MKQGWFKDRLVEGRKYFTGIPGAVVTVFSIISFLKIVESVFFLCSTIALGIATTILFGFYLKKVKVNRENFALVNAYLKAFNKTHNTWHEYKKLSDALHQGLDLDDVAIKINSIISNVLVNLRSALEDIHKDNTIRVCVKEISYRNLKKLDEINEKSYKELDFVLNDMEMRDPKATPQDNECIVHGLKFEKQDGDNFSRLKNTLFYRAFLTKKIAFCDKYNSDQKSVSTKYESGMVAPVVLFDIPFALICLGSKNECIFNTKDEQLVATFTDCLAELIRLYLIFRAISKSRKIIVLSEEELRLIEQYREDDTEKEIIKEG